MEIKDPLSTRLINLPGTFKKEFVYYTLSNVLFENYLIKYGGGFSTRTLNNYLNNIHITCGNESLHVTIQTKIKSENPKKMIHYSFGERPHQSEYGNLEFFKNPYTDKSKVDIKLINVIYKILINLYKNIVDNNPTLIANCGGKRISEIKEERALLDDPFTEYEFLKQFIELEYSSSTPNTPSPRSNSPMSISPRPRSPRTPRQSDLRESYDFNTVVIGKGFEFGKSKRLKGITNDILYLILN